MTDDSGRSGHSDQSDVVETPPTSAAISGVEAELAKERTFGGYGIDVDRTIECIDVSDFELRRDEIDNQIWSAATDIGFFQVTGHGIDQQQIDEAFALAEAFFSLPTEVKQRWPLRTGTNSGWEYRAQKRPSTGTLDQKESYQITTSRMERLELWPSTDDLAGFRAVMEAFERANWDLAMRLLGCFARKLGFEDDFFTQRHNPSSPEYQSTLRLLHYLPMSAADLDDRIWRAGAHTDYDCLTLLHQRPGQHGLQLSSGAEADRRDDASTPLEWTSVDPTPGTVTCNIGDMLMRWSDDLLPSTLHRVRMPSPDEYLGPRYSMAFFAQADCDAIIESPSSRHEPMTASDYLQQRIAANFAG